MQQQINSKGGGGEIRAEWPGLKETLLSQDHCPHSLVEAHSQGIKIAQTLEGVSIISSDIVVFQAPVRTTQTRRGSGSTSQIIV